MAALISMYMFDDSTLMCVESFLKCINEQSIYIVFAKYNKNKLDHLKYAHLMLVVYSPVNNK